MVVFVAKLQQTAIYQENKTAKEIAKKRQTSTIRRRCLIGKKWHQSPTLTVSCNAPLPTFQNKLPSPTTALIHDIRSTIYIIMTYCKNNPCKWIHRTYAWCCSYIWAHVVYNITLCFYFLNIQAFPVQPSQWRRLEMKGIAPNYWRDR